MKKLSVLGGGESGVAAALLAYKNGFEVFVSDYGSIHSDYKSELIDNSIPFEEKGHSIEKIISADVIIKSPGISDDVPLVQKLLKYGKRLISEIEFASQFYDGKIIGVTGSNGKSTTVSIIYHLLHTSGLSAGLGGNIGHAFSRLLIDNTDYDYIVLELSSFQLEGIKKFSTDIAVILNISDDHLDRYNNDINLYAAAKWKLVESVKEDGVIILNEEDVLSQNLLKKHPVKVTKMLISSENPIKSLSKDDGSLFEINLLGKHNLFNAAVSKQVALLCKVSEGHIQDGLQSFNALEHRLESVTELNNVLYVNDSKATNVDAVKYAISAVHQPIVWIAGGTDKGNDYTGLIDIVKGKVKVLICLGVDCEKLKASFVDVIPEVLELKSMQEAVNIAYDKAEENDLVLLSPACASFDLFDNYIHRGNEFKKEIFKIKNGII